MQFSTTMKQGTSKQEWLANVRVCPECGGQKPKDTFKRVDGVDLCLDCQEEHAEMAVASN